MAQNLFEKYGIKEVADVTLYRIERKEETYESQRKISISSILKGALTKDMVYPLDADGKGEVDGYEAYVFKDADILTHYNYDCDDVVTVKGTGYYTDIEGFTDDLTGLVVGKAITDQDAIDSITDDIKADEDGDNVPNLFDAPDHIAVKSMLDKETRANMLGKVYRLLASGYVCDMDTIDVTSTSITFMGTTKSQSTIGSLDLIAYRSDLIAPISVKGTVDVAKLKAAFEAHGGELEADGTTVTGGYIVLPVPADADPDAVRALFAINYKDILDETGIICRFTQPMSTGQPFVLSDSDAADGAEGDADEDATATPDTGYNIFRFEFEVTLSSTEEAQTGIYDLNSDVDNHNVMDADREAGTHEFSYAEQVCMLFAKNQNLITKIGTRYYFEDADGMFGGFEFDDNFATAPNGRERVVVVGLPGRISENLYDLEEVDGAIKDLAGQTIEAKAYDITYTDYAELAVEDEMGYYLPQQIGYALDKKSGKVSFFDNVVTYEDYAKAGKGKDIGIANATETWGDAQHYSINDAIDALKQQAKLVDGTSEVTESGFDRIFGGYEVRGKSLESTKPVNDKLGIYDDFMLNGEPLKDPVTGEHATSNYNLASVLDTLATAVYPSQIGQVRVSSTWEVESNRAIYVDPENGGLANRAYIYLLKNVSRRGLAADKDGIFEFRDKKGNKLFYQDIIFAGTACLALVVIGNRGLIFVVDRHCCKNFTQTAWMINDNGYITDKQAERIVRNGLIHTVTVTACDESFDATATVGSIKVRKTKKNVLRYVPVLFLDTLKVSTLEQASESTDATGGRGNAKLITWDYGKEITLSIEDALYTPASMAAIWAGENGDLKNGVKDTTMIDRMEKITAKRSFIVPAGNQDGTPSEGNVTAQAVYYDPKTMEPFQDGTPIAEGEVVYKFTRSVAYEGNSIGNTIEISADKFPGTYRVVGETLVRDKNTGEDQRFQFIIPEAKMSASDAAITLEADGDPVVFSFSMSVLRPDNGVMMKFVQFDVQENTEENDGSTMVKDTENLNLLDSAEMYKVSGEDEEELVIGATEY